MNRKTISVGLYEVNCSILFADRECWVVDPGADAAAIVAALPAGLVPTAILLTHAHFDHIGAIPELQRRFPNLPVYVHPNDAKIIAHPLNQLPPDYPALTMPTNVRDCRELRGVTVIETPGHTPGGVCYHFEDDGLLLSGDTLFAGSAGRTDFPGGSMGALLQSLAVLKALPADTMVIPGHGNFTTIGQEAKANPFLR